MVTLTQKIPRDPNPSDCLALRRDPDPAVPSPAAHGPPVGSEALQYAAPAEIASRDNAARFVRVVLFVTFLVTMACASFIFYRNLHSRFPTSYILLIPTGDQPVEETDVTVGDAQREIAKLKLTAENHEMTPILVEPGIYTVTVNQHGTIRRQQIFVPHRRQVVVAIPMQLPQTR
jgi:hypothetical protein